MCRTKCHKLSSLKKDKKMPKKTKQLQISCFCKKSKEYTQILLYSSFFHEKGSASKGT